MSNINVLFYSNNCEGSKNLLSLMQNENLIRFFHLVCTDNNPKIPQQITRTPTIVIKGIPTPYVASDAFIWLSKVKQWKINMTMKKISESQQNYLQNNLSINSNNNQILGFNPNEMSSMSDMFSFFSKEMTQECDEALPQSYLTYNNLGVQKIFLVPDVDTKNNTIKEAEHLKLYKNIEQERKNQDKIIKQSIDVYRKK